jgi:hypothetical protein
MKRDLAWWLRRAVPVVAVAAVGVGLAGSGIFGGDEDPEPTARTVRVGPQGISLVAYDSCPAALEELRSAMVPLVGAYGLAGDGRAVMEDGATPPLAPGAAGAPAERNGGAAAPKQAEAPAQEPTHSKTNTHEAGVDEPDLVKTDGRRLITVADGRLHVIDVVSRKETAVLELPGGQASQMLLDGDRALVMTVGGMAKMPSRSGKPAPPQDMAFESQIVLVDLAGAAKVVGTLSVEGSYLDARQIGSVARVVVRSAPRFNFVYPDGARTEGEAKLRNEEIVRTAPITDWLPRYQLEQNGSVNSGQLVDCMSVSRPESFTGTGMLTVLTFDLGKELGRGDPVSIVADGDTVYGTGNSLYVADDHYSHGAVGGFAPRRTPPANQRTEIYQLDISKPGKPVYVAAGGVDGALLNQYSLSEHAGHLRVATTLGQPGRRDQKSESAVTVLARKGDTLAQLGRIGGLGVGERIYAVRFIGPIGYVVTFRQTDPLYTVDLSNPSQPKVVGELKITGYSAYLHAADSGRLIGVGQEATEQGRRMGTQISLFDTTNLASVNRVAQHQLPGSSSEVEFDPHAFLYWKEKGLVVVPVMSSFQRENGKSGSGALVLRLSGNSFTEVGMVSHLGDPYRYPDTSVRRALVIGDELWTVSGSGVMVNDIERLAQRAWIPFS